MLMPSYYLYIRLPYYNMGAILVVVGQNAVVEL